jgi:hypothetical protein
LSDHQDTILYKALGIQGVGYAVYLFFTGTYIGALTSIIGGSTYLPGVGLLLAGLIILFSGLILFKSKEPRSKTAGSLFTIAGLAALLAGALAAWPNTGHADTIVTLSVGLFMALVSMANPTLGLVVLKRYGSDSVVKYSTVLYILSPLLLVYGLTGLSLGVLVASTIIYLEIKGLPEHADTLNKALEKVVKEISD